MNFSRIDDLKSLIIVTDYNNKFIYFNKSWLKFRGKDLASELLSTVDDYIHSEDIHNFNETLKLVSIQKEPGFIIFRLIDTYGENKWMHAVMMPEISVEGKYIGCAIYCNDFTEKMNFEEKYQINAKKELQKSYQDTEAILHAIPTPICVIGKSSGMILSVNVAFKNMYCIIDNDNIDLLGTHFSEYFIKFNDNSDYIINRLNRSINLKCNFKKQDGTYIEIEIVSRPFVYKDQEAYAVYCMDLTGQRRLQKVLLEVATAAEEASKMKSSFLANMSHEIRTPLNGVIGFTDLALDDPEISENSKEYFQKIKVSANGLLQIINEILDISKIEAGKIELEYTPFSLYDVFEHCETVSSVKANEKGLKLTFYSEPFLSKMLIGDPTRLRQVLLNLLSNSIKFTNQGEIKLISVIEESRSKVKIHFEVEDTGIGMTNDQIKRIFDPFTQADNSTTRKYGGTGLGLTITKSIIEHMGGDLKVESVPDIGSKFSFDLIFDTIECNEVKTKEKLNRPIFSGDVLVCEDNTINQQVIQEHLIRIGFHVFIAPNGKIGVEMVKNRMLNGNPFDIILMDIHMPVMDGLEAMAKLREIGSITPVIAMTANVMSNDKENYLSHGMSGYIGKPFVAGELWDCLLNILTPIKFTSVEAANKKIQKADKIIQSDSQNISNAPDVSQFMIINKKLGMERADDDEGLYHHLLLNFLKDNQHVIKELKQAIAEKDFKLAHRIAHTLKGVAAMIGAIKLSNVAAMIESSLSNKMAITKEDMVSNDIEVSLLMELETQLNAVFYELKPLLEEQEAQEEKKRQNNKIDKKLATKIIFELEPLLQNGNSKCNDLIDDIKYTFSSLTEICEQLIRQMENYDFDLALETLHDIKAYVNKINESICI